MKKLAIKAEHISKQYRLGQIGTGTLSHDLNRFWHKLRGKPDPYLKIGEQNDRSKKGESEYVWSLKDINFEIEQGDAVGIIGRNGAGKSTLLKILSKVTQPTTGSIKVNGRIASLLEVGTGFHPEMTGRENIYMNGAILGMRKKEIDRKLDEIIDFSGVERYIDTPVKRYSSGMYVRLAFAVAAHLESEILIVDEVLAVGDAEFQKKCLGKMGEVSKGEGRTVLFVSHDMGAIKQFCSKACLLNKGQIEKFSDVNTVINLYRNSESSKVNNLIQNITSNGIKFNKSFFSKRSYTNAEDIVLKIEYSLYLIFPRIRIVVGIYNEANQLLFEFSDLHNNEQELKRECEVNYLSQFIIPSKLLTTGKYFYSIRFDSPFEKVYLNIDLQFGFEIETIVFHNMGVLFSDEPKGILNPEIKSVIQEI